MPGLRGYIIIALALTLALSFQAGPCQAGEVVDMDPEQIVALLKEDPDVVIIDLRTPPEFREGRLENAININAVSPDFERLLRNDKRLQDHDWLVYCRTGHRSRAAMPVLKRHAPKTIYHMDGGITAWIGAGNEIVK